MDKWSRLWVTIESVFEQLQPKPGRASFVQTPFDAANEGWVYWCGVCNISNFIFEQQQP